MNLKAKSIILVALCAVQVSWGADPLDNWTTSNSSNQGVVEAIAFDNGRFVRVGAAGAVATSPDGAIWTPRTSGTTNDLYAVAHGNG
jgi:hypothetical protein